MNLPKPTSMKYDELIIAVENGKMKIPQFQRDFVWTKNKSADLLDSMDIPFKKCTLFGILVHPYPV